MQALVVNARRCNLDGNTNKRLGPIYFHPELDTLLCAVWDGQRLSPVGSKALPQRILKQARHLVITELGFQEIIVDSRALPTKTERINLTYNILRQYYEKLETVSILYNCPEVPDQGPWKLKLECFRDLMAPAGSTYTRNVARWKSHLKEIELAYPDWKAPTLKQIGVQCTKAFAKK